MDAADDLWGNNVVNFAPQAKNFQVQNGSFFVADDFLGNNVVNFASQAKIFGVNFQVSLQK